MKMDKQMASEVFDTDFENVLDNNTEKELMMTQEEMLFWNGVEGEGEGSYTRKSFVFHPNYLSAYDALKRENPELAIIYLEALMRFGVDRKRIPNEAEAIPLVMAFLDGNMKTIEANYRDYKNGLLKAKRNAKKYFKEARKKRERFY